MRIVVDGCVDLRNLCLTKLPDLSDCEVTGYFDCSENRLTSLEGAPKRVGTDFLCSNNQLTSLVGAPEWVGRDFDCWACGLASLAGAPSYVFRAFSCYNNPTNFTEDDVRAVCDAGECLDEEVLDEVYGDDWDDDDDGVE
jgi:hypothetical protein